MRLDNIVRLVVLFTILGAVALHGEDWQAGGALSAANLRGAKPHFISFMPAADSVPRLERMQEAPRPMRYFEKESSFSPLKEYAQQDGASRGPSLEPMDAHALIKNMAGISYHGLSPSDSTIAVGPLHVVVAVNSSLAIYLKGGAKLVQTKYEDFFANFDEVQGAFFFDPKLAYDQYNGHFILIVDAVRDSDNRSWYMLAVSKTSDVRAGWIGWALDMGLNGSARTPLWGDYPGLGYDSQAIFMTANMYNKAGSFQYAKLRVLRKSEVYAFSGDLGWHDFWQLRDATGAKSFTVQPVRSFGTVGVEYMISVNPFQGAAVTLWTVNASTATPQVSKKRINVPSFKTASNYSADQKGGGSLLDVLDSRLSDAVFRNGFIYVGHTIQHDWGSGIVASLRIYTLTSNGTLQQSLTFGNDRSSYFFPAVTADPKGNVILVFDRSTPVEFAGVRFTTQPAGSSDFQASTLLKAGIANYFWSPDNFGVERWGDYSGIANDEDGSVWIHSQYADTASKEWTTRVGRLKY